MRAFMKLYKIRNFQLHTKVEELLESLTITDIFVVPICEKVQIYKIIFYDNKINTPKFPHKTFINLSG